MVDERMKRCHLKTKAAVQLCIDVGNGRGSGKKQHFRNFARLSSTKKEICGRARRVASNHFMSLSLLRCRCTTRHCQESQLPMRS
jgi:hypothetical protein